MTAPRSSGHHAALRGRLAMAAERIIARALAEQYADPFWYARYGERADRRGREDGLYHLQYLDQALAAADRGVLEHYARWLQPMLTSRGMCTRHLVEHFDRLGRAIAAEGVPDALVAVEFLTALGAALDYGPTVSGGAAHAFQDDTPRLLAAAQHDVAITHPDQAQRCAEDLAMLAAYVADALALGGPATLVGHATWLAGFQPAAYVRALFAALRAHALPGTPAAAALDAAMLALATT